MAADIRARGPALTTVFAVVYVPVLLAHTAWLVKGPPPPADVFMNTLVLAAEYLPVVVAAGLLGRGTDARWMVQGRFLAQAAALRPDVPPFEHSRAVVTGAWWPVFGLTLLSALSQLAPLSWTGLAVTTLYGGGPAGILHAVGAAVLSTYIGGFRSVVDTRVFLHLEAQNGLAPRVP